MAVIKGFKKTCIYNSQNTTKIIQLLVSSNAPQMSIFETEVNFQQILKTYTRI
jgi:hypothetical protein